MGIQRPLNKDRANEIKEYVKNIDATFPTGILLSLDSEFVRYDEEMSVLEISYPPGTSPAKILDGQHRIAGFMDIKTGKAIYDLCWFEQGEDKVPFELVVTIFVGLDMAEQANIFATVNIKQTKVSKSLVYDLEAYSNTRSPQKTAHEITIALAKHPQSPFWGKIKRLGRKEGEFETLTQAAIVGEIISLISKDEMKDRDYLLRKERGAFSSFRKDLDRSSYHDNLVFRNAFIDGNDSLILKTLTAFFVAVQEKWPTAWEKGNNKSVLNRTVGINALFRVFREYCRTKFSEVNECRIISVEEFRKYFAKCDLVDAYFENLDAKSATISKLSQEIMK